MVQLLLAVIYICFISMGLPDSLLGSAWPTMGPLFGVPVSYAGIVSMIISLSTVVSSLLSDRVTRRFGTGPVCAFSVCITAAGVFGFSFSRSFTALCLWAVPYGFGAGSLDAAINNYAAIHYESRHMSWLHSMWGVGAAVGPYIMGRALTSGAGWDSGYRLIGYTQVIMAFILFMSLPLWKKGETKNEAPERRSVKTDRSFGQLIRIPGVREILFCFIFYCAVEQTSGLWGVSYLNLYKGIPAETAAGYGSMFFIGVTAGRMLSGFLLMKLTDRQMIRLGQAVIALGLIILLLPVGSTAALAGLILVGLGCSPVYPCMVKITPGCFGEDLSQTVVGLEGACGYLGSTIMPPFFGWIAERAGIGLMPVFLMLLLSGLFFSHEILLKKVLSSGAADTGTGRD